MAFITPLSLFVVWHPNYSEGQNIADFLYSSLCRNVSKPLVRSIGIPLYFRSTNAPENNCPNGIDYNESEHIAVIALVSDEFVIDENYCNYLDAIFDECAIEPHKRRVFPIAVSNAAFNVSRKFSEINFIRVNHEADIRPQIKSPILHELCRLMLNMKKATDETTSTLISPPIKLFISHSKHDDSMVDASKFKDYINSQTQLKTFFDANDIAYGSNFGVEIKKAAHESTLVVFQSDSYAEREWCRIEILEAKTAGCPIVIVNVLENIEQRTFPYLGNNPSIRFKNNFIDIIDLTLEQVLSNLYTKKFLHALTEMYNVIANKVLSTPPELFNFIQLKKGGDIEKGKVSVVIYPDPPLGSEEMEILNQMDDNFIFITPLTLPSILNK